MYGPTKVTKNSQICSRNISTPQKIKRRSIPSKCRANASAALKWPTELCWRSVPLTYLINIPAVHYHIVVTCVSDNNAMYHGRIATTYARGVAAIFLLNFDATRLDMSKTLLLFWTPGHALSLCLILIVWIIHLHQISADNDWYDRRKTYSPNWGIEHRIVMKDQTDARACD